jgi:hypothetical protein
MMLFRQVEEEEIVPTRFSNYFGMIRKLSMTID